MRLERKLARFKVTSVFDLSQTDGKPLPTLAETLTGDVRQYELFEAGHGSEVFGVFIAGEKLRHQPVFLQEQKRVAAATLFCSCFLFYFYFIKWNSESICYTLAISRVGLKAVSSVSNFDFFWGVSHSTRCIFK